MTKHLKHLILLFLAFGLMVNDSILDSQSNSAEYYQVSYLKTENKFSHKDSKSYQFYQIHLSKKIVSPILFPHLKFQDLYNLQTRVFLKLRIALYQNISAIKAQGTFLIKTITSSNHDSDLYIA
ncbi:hypothetical protein [Flavobacterium sp. WC2509]|uniref:hypothetical protein n=1 Tax=Flavobacterium sp. WC2509 TaxID=3461406 RepID=UPI00404474F1